MQCLEQISYDWSSDWTCYIMQCTRCKTTRQVFICSFDGWSMFWRRSTERKRDKLTLRHGQTTRSCEVTNALILGQTGAVEQIWMLKLLSDMLRRVTWRLRQRLSLQHNTPSAPSGWASSQTPPQDGPGYLCPIQDGLPPKPLPQMVVDTPAPSGWADRKSVV